MFAAITPAIACDAIAERARLGPIFMLDIEQQRMELILGGLDFAGGTPVHISSGTAALAISVYWASGGEMNRGGLLFGAVAGLVSITPGSGFLDLRIPRNRWNGRKILTECGGFDGFTEIPGTIILWIVHFIPGLRLRTTEEAEILGIDDAEMPGEFAYNYISLDQEIGHSIYVTMNGAAGCAREPRYERGHKGGGE
ncbi:hypothetical protein BDQ17DRAFT_1331596 [Cyathus striatus]|nr:hypothetical protein BDQ17DRAFT_1331596 [Cyathus striatus]